MFSISRGDRYKDTRKRGAARLQARPEEATIFPQRSSILQRRLQPILQQRGIKTVKAAGASTTDKSSSALHEVRQLRYARCS